MESPRKTKKKIKKGRKGHANDDDDNDDDLETSSKYSKGKKGSRNSKETKDTIVNQRLLAMEGPVPNFSAKPQRFGSAEDLHDSTKSADLATFNGSKHNIGKKGKKGPTRDICKSPVENVVDGAEIEEGKKKKKKKKKRGDTPVSFSKDVTFGDEDDHVSCSNGSKSSRHSSKLTSSDTLMGSSGALTASSSSLLIDDSRNSRTSKGSKQKTAPPGRRGMPIKARSEAFIAEEEFEPQRQIAKKKTKSLRHIGDESKSDRKEMRRIMSSIVARNEAGRARKTQKKSELESELEEEKEPSRGKMPPQQRGLQRGKSAGGITTRLMGGTETIVRAKSMRGGASSDDEEVGVSAPFRGREPKWSSKPSGRGRSSDRDPKTEADRMASVERNAVARRERLSSVERARSGRLGSMEKDKSGRLAAMDKKKSGRMGPGEKSKSKRLSSVERKKVNHTEPPEKTNSWVMFEQLVIDRFESEKVQTATLNDTRGRTKSKKGRMKRSRSSDALVSRAPRETAEPQPDYTAKLGVSQNEPQQQQQGRPSRSKTRSSKPLRRSRSSDMLRH